jgi:hypothetical protein
MVLRRPQSFILEEASKQVTDTEGINSAMFHCNHKAPVQQGIGTEIEQTSLGTEIWQVHIFKFFKKSTQTRNQSIGQKIFKNITAS